MTETSQQYIARLLGYLGKKDPLSVLSGSPRKIKKLIQNHSIVTLNNRPNPAKWSVTEIVAHLAESELVMGWRYRSIAEKNGTNIQSFDQNIWEKNARYATISVDDWLLLFTQLRKMNIRFLEGLPKKKLLHYGMHEERGKETIAHIMRLEAGHDLNHLQQIEAILYSKK